MYIYIYIYIYTQQVVQCFHIFLHPFDDYVIFFLQLPLSFQSSSINPFRPGKFKSTSFSSSWWAPFRNFFW